ncbi:hypothetical protein RJZ90_001879 [Blastomyces dermatitidis]
MLKLMVSVPVLLWHFARHTLAHGDHSQLPEGQVISGDPLDSILWIHIILMTVAFGLIFPTGMVLGITRSRWHVPVQIVGSIIAILAYFMGHLHKGRQFSKNIHASFANVLMIMLVAQVVLGIYLKLHLSRGIHGRIRQYVVGTHGVVGKVMPVVSWVQMIFGGITALGFCRKDHLGQCLAHFIMGSAFIAYGILLTILLLVGQYWLRRTGRSQEFFDSVVIAVWGCINTFTEHRWGQPWAHNDIEHTSMGIVWWCAGLLGIWLSRKRNGQPKRNLIPGVVILLTGYSMSSHQQHLMLSTMVHAFFGYTLMGAGAARIIEIAFVLKDRSTLSLDGTDPNSFQYITPFHRIHPIPILLVVNVLIHVYAVHAWPETAKYNGSRPSSRSRRLRGHPPTSTPHGNGRMGPNGHIRRQSQIQHIHDAEEFELEGLIGGADKDQDDDSPISTPLDNGAKNLERAP